MRALRKTAIKPNRSMGLEPTWEPNQGHKSLQRSRIKQRGLSNRLGQPSLVFGKELFYTKQIFDQFFRYNFPFFILEDLR